MRRILQFVFTLIIIFCCTLMVQAQSVRYQVALPYLGMGAYSTHQNDPFSFTANQAALAQTKSTGLGVYGERRFMMEENSLYGLAFALPTSMGNFGISANYAGFSGFNENKIGLAYARSLGSKVDVGVQFNYYSYQIPQYSSASAINFEAGLIMHLTDKLNAGIHVYNPVGGELGKNSDEKLAAAYKLGVGYDASEDFTFSAELLKEEDRSINVIAAAQYNFAKQFFARAGFLSETGTGFAGLGVGWKKFRLDVSGSYHPQLGFSPGLLLIVNFKESRP